MGNLRQLAVGCALIATTPDKFECSSAFGALLSCITQIPAAFSDVQVIRLVKGPKEAKSAASRGINLREYSTPQGWNYIFFVDRDKHEVPRAVVYNNGIAAHPSQLSSNFTSIAITYKDTLKEFKAFTRHPVVKVRSKVELGEWKFTAYTDRSPLCYRLVITGPSGDDISVPNTSVLNQETIPVPRPGATSPSEPVPQPIQREDQAREFRNLATNAFSRFR